MLYRAGKLRLVGSSDTVFVVSRRSGVKRRSASASPVSPLNASTSTRAVVPLRQIPPVIARMLATYRLMKGQSREDLHDLFVEIADSVSAEGILDYLEVFDVTIATFEILHLYQAKTNIIERMRHRRQHDLALSEATTLATQRAAARVQGVGYTKYMEDIEDQETKEGLHAAFVALQGDPHPPLNAPPYMGAYSEADVAKYKKPLDTPADDGQAFLDAAGALKFVDDMLGHAHARRDAALQRILQHRRNFASALRKVSDRVIDGTVNKQVTTQDDEE